MRTGVIVVLLCALLAFVAWWWHQSDGDSTVDLEPVATTPETGDLGTGPLLDARVDTARPREPDVEEPGKRPTFVQTGGRPGHVRFHGRRRLGSGKPATRGQVDVRVVRGTEEREATIMGSDGEGGEFEYFVPVAPEDEEVRFRYMAPRHEPFKIVVRAIGGSSHHLDIQLSHGLVLRGRLVDARGAPCAFGFVRVKEAGSTSTLTGFVGNCPTDEHGRFECIGLGDAVHILSFPDDRSRLEIAGKPRRPVGLGWTYKPLDSDRIRPSEEMQDIRVQKQFVVSMVFLDGRTAALLDRGHVIGRGTIAGEDLAILRAPIEEGYAELRWNVPGRATDDMLAFDLSCEVPGYEVGRVIRNPKELLGMSHGVVKLQPSKPPDRGTVRLHLVDRRGDPLDVDVKVHRTDQLGPMPLQHSFPLYGGSDRKTLGIRKVGPGVLELTEDVGHHSVTIVPTHAAFGPVFWQGALEFRVDADASPRRIEMPPFAMLEIEIPKAAKISSLRLRWLDDPNEAVQTNVFRHGMTRSVKAGTNRFVLPPGRWQLTPFGKPVDPSGSIDVDLRDGATTKLSWR